MYDASSTIGAARAVYFETNGFGANGGYDETWVPVKVGPAEFLIRNTASRVRSVRLHDVHHLVTGYATTLTGESLIGAWELGSGCRDHFAAWFLNVSASAFGIVLAPRSLWRAFVRGRHSENLYGGEWSDALLDRTVGDLRRELRVDEPHAATFADAILFAVFVGAGIYMLLWTIAFAPLLAVATIVYKLRAKKR